MWIDVVCGAAIVLLIHGIAMLVRHRIERERGLGNPIVNENTVGKLAVGLILTVGVVCAMVYNYTSTALTVRWTTYANALMIGGLSACLHFVGRMSVAQKAPIKIGRE